jgi:hypothetical protein
MRELASRAARAIEQFGIYVSHEATEKVDTAGNSSLPCFAFVSFGRGSILRYQFSATHQRLDDVYVVSDAQKIGLNRADGILVRSDFNHSCNIRIGVDGG